MKVINLFGGGGAGKSTTAAGLFHFMKLENIKVELVTEYAKELTYEGHKNILSDQLYVTAEQNRRLQRLKGQVDWVITDSPLLLGRVYAQYYKYDYRELYLSFVEDLFNSYHNENFFITRVKPYKTFGRNETEEQAKEIDECIKATLLTYEVKDIPGDKNAPQKILSILRDTYNL